MSKRTLADLAREAGENPIRWLIPYTVIQDGIHILHGREESYKTQLVMQLLEALNVGGQFLVWDIRGGQRVGFAELEMTERMFGARALEFIRTAKRQPEISILTEAQRRRILRADTTLARVEAVIEWAKGERLEALGIDSIAKLFPPAANTGSQPVVTDLFSHLQDMGCAVILIGHPRKRSQLAEGKNLPGGNDEIAGSGRFAQNPDIVIEANRADRRAPMATLSWGKNRLIEKPGDLDLFFDRVALRLFPIHPFLHLLPASREQLIEEASLRYRWRRTHADRYIASLKMLRGSEGREAISETRDNRRAVFQLDPYVSLAELWEYSHKNECDMP